MKKIIINYLNKTPYIRGLYNELKYFKHYHRFEPEHYHNPIPNKKEVEETHDSSLLNNLEGIDYDFENQIPILEKLYQHYSELPWDFINDQKNTLFRYKLKDSYYRYSDAIFLFLIMREFKPKKVIEIGSGFSTATMLDTNDLFFKENKIEFTFIEPNPYDRLENLITDEDRMNCKILPQRVQEVDISIYKELKENDILFIDSSHVSKCGSDLNFIMFNILPILNKGVLIHFHDVFYPFEYPKHWILEEKFYWNECYILRSFMMYNKNFDILFFNSAAHKFHEEYLKTNMPEVLIDHINTGALWIIKNK
jgi:hypothetical protein